MFSGIGRIINVGKTKKGPTQTKGYPLSSSAGIHFEHPSFRCHRNVAFHLQHEEVARVPCLLFGVSHDARCRPLSRCPNVPHCADLGIFVASSSFCFRESPAARLTDLLEYFLLADLHSRKKSTLAYPWLAATQQEGCNMTLHFYS